MILKPTIKYGYVTVKYDSWHGVDLLEGEMKRRIGGNPAAMQERDGCGCRPMEKRVRNASAIDGKVTSLTHAKFLEQFQHAQRVVELD
jgi:hypothetical protein